MSSFAVFRTSVGLKAKQPERVIARGHTRCVFGSPHRRSAEARDVVQQEDIINEQDVAEVSQEIDNVRQECFLRAENARKCERAASEVQREVELLREVLVTQRHELEREREREREATARLKRVEEERKMLKHEVQRLQHAIRTLQHSIRAAHEQQAPARAGTSEIAVLRGEASRLAREHNEIVRTNPGSCGGVNAGDGTVACLRNEGVSSPARPQENPAPLPAPSNYARQSSEEQASVNRRASLKFPLDARRRRPLAFLQTASEHPSLVPAHAITAPQASASSESRLATEADVMCDIRESHESPAMVPHKPPLAPHHRRYFGGIVDFR